MPRPAPALGDGGAAAWTVGLRTESEEMKLSARVDEAIARRREVLIAAKLSGKA